MTSLRHIQEANTEPKYVAKTSVEQKVGPVHGWQELLSSVGLHIIEHVKKEVPPMIFFPDHDDSGMQRKYRQHIESLFDNDQVSTACSCMKLLETALGIGNQFLPVVMYAVKLIHTIMSQLQKWLFKKMS